ncbi:extracellular solute-binding protein [Paroceanicella profunda]|uniref:Extracellular solute-binding protein n=1 Tax=Paroceanicella profunda TaxID=2579971 RepID=A0A5B8FZA4_9RHOB|nr:extracellular solute-binding protein [Paroceanicella profunda]QDL92059.1 extracellular solute-binding protein [Paroceanicella profunda]
MAPLSGLTWDHPRGYSALAAAAAEVAPGQGLSLTWARQPLEGFESAPIAELCAAHDLVVLDHPHVGEAVEAGCLHPLEEVFGPAELAAIGARTIGPCLASYRYAGRHWALPLDAATQVMATRPDLLETPPATWQEVLALSRGGTPVALSLAGPHVLMSLFSVCTALGAPPALRPQELLPPEVACTAWEILSELAGRSPAALRPLNPIGILNRMAAEEIAACVPLIYGYVTYAAPASGTALRFSDAPRATPGGRPGGTLGGTGIGLSRRVTPTPELRTHLRWLMSEAVQRGFIPDHDGQPSARAAWADAGVNARWRGFYAGTAATLEASCVRPRFAGYIAFQTAASERLRAALEAREPAARAMQALQDLYDQSRPGGTET